MSVVTSQGALTLVTSPSNVFRTYTFPYLRGIPVFCFVKLPRTNTWHANDRQKP